MNELNVLWTARAECAMLECQIDMLQQRQKKLPLLFLGEEREELSGQLEEQISRLRESHRGWMEREKDVEELIQEVEDARVRAVLYLRYVCLLQWSEIEEKLVEKNLYYTMRQIYNFHARGLREVEKALAQKKRKTNSQNPKKSTGTAVPCLL